MDIITLWNISRAVEHLGEADERVGQQLQISGESKRPAYFTIIHHFVHCARQSSDTGSDALF
jgi:hypothetical protein